MMMGKNVKNMTEVIETTIRNIRSVSPIVCTLVVGSLMLLTNPQPAYACNYDPPDDYDANVHSPTSASITTTSATLGGSVSRGSHYDGCNMVSDVISYRYIDYGTSPGSYGSNVNITGNISGAYTISVTGLTPGTTYYFRARATTNYGSYTSGESSFTTTAPPDTTPPSTPGAMTTSWSGDHYINTSFTANTTGSTDNVGVTSYSLCRSTDNAGGCAVWVAQGIGTSYTVSGADLPSTGTFRYYSWYAYDAAGY